jgi:hypothetical protein
MHNPMVGCGTTRAPGAEDETPDGLKFLCKACSVATSNSSSETDEEQDVDGLFNTQGSSTSQII